MVSEERANRVKIRVEVKAHPFKVKEMVTVRVTVTEMERANPMAKEKERVKAKVKVKDKVKAKVRAKVRAKVKTVMLTKKAKITPTMFLMN